MSNAIFAVFNGLIYGPVIGFLMNLTANVLGNFVFVKILEMIDLKENDTKLKKHFASLKNVIDAVENQELGIMIGYMIPVIPTILINYHVAKIKLPWRRWFFYVTVGVAPSSLLYALGGDAVVAGNIKRIIVLFVVFVSITLLGSYFKRKKKK
ncbi:TVP38/TMEM64 family protein [Streptococcus vicugnae]|uniref:TVP38/TMEM64 family protein n=2 Tax=Streptococcus TaxID=1301 RepID=UPI00201E430E|nr:VTT domain-containing protein [Streptococcus vicugnae]